MAANSYLILRRAACAGVPLDALRQALAAAPVASVLLEGVTSETVTADRLAGLITIGQQAGAAVLLDDIALARGFAADGVHLPFVEDPDRAEAAYQAARAALGGENIVGVDAGLSRHHAMLLGEAGADYIAFAGSDASQQCDLVGWWAELFEPPVVAWDVQSGLQSAALLAARVDFIAASAPTADSVASAAQELARWLRGDGA